MSGISATSNMWSFWKRLPYACELLMYWRRHSLPLETRDNLLNKYSKPPGLSKRKNTSTVFSASSKRQRNGTSAGGWRLGVQFQVLDDLTVCPTRLNANLRGPSSYEWFKVRCLIIGMRRKLRLSDHDHLRVIFFVNNSIMSGKLPLAALVRRMVQPYYGP